MLHKKGGIMVVLSSPSGAGKTTLVNLLSKKNNYCVSISHTTRKPRSNETNGKDYFFVKDDEFKRLINNDEFLEYAKVFNNFYGTTRTPVIQGLEKNQNIIFDIDWQGADQIKKPPLAGNADPNSLATSAMGNAQTKGNAKSNSMVSPGPDEDTIASIPKEPPDTKM